MPARKNKKIQTETDFPAAPVCDFITHMYLPDECDIAYTRKKNTFKMYKIKKIVTEILLFAVLFLMQNEGKYKSFFFFHEKNPI